MFGWVVSKSTTFGLRTSICSESDVCEANSIRLFRYYVVSMNIETTSVQLKLCACVYDVDLPWLISTAKPIGEQEMQFHNISPMTARSSAFTLLINLVKAY